MERDAWELFTGLKLNFSLRNKVSTLYETFNFVVMYLVEQQLALLVTLIDLALVLAYHSIF